MFHVLHQRNKGLIVFWTIITAALLLGCLTGTEAQVNQAPAYINATKWDSVINPRPTEYVIQLTDPSYADIPVCFVLLDSTKHCKTIAEWLR